MSKKMKKIDKILKDRLIFIKTKRYPTKKTSTNDGYSKEDIYMIKDTKYYIGIRQTGSAGYYIYDDERQVLPLKFSPTQEKFIDELKKYIRID